MKALDFKEMEQLEGGSCVGSAFLAAAAIGSMVLLVSNPFTGPATIGSLVISATAANMAAGTLAGIGVGGAIADTVNQCR